MMDRLAAASLERDRGRSGAADFALRARRARPSRDNCAPCHGAGGGGAKGYPNLNDDDWLWGGTLDEIQQTIRIGIRSGRRRRRAHGADAGLRPRRHAEARRDRGGRRLRALARRSAGRRRAPTSRAGKKVFADNCAACHGDDGKGNRELGAPDLTDEIWLYGSDKATIVEAIANGRGGVMPAWAGRLDPTTIKALASTSTRSAAGEK